ncbi:MAG: diaminopimelate epimerase [Pyrinomonadaceae bacterium]|nr:diaminopimelate epimerase [Pyrinomonadaceae bacterium]
MNFCKFQGFGNDYLIFAANDLSEIDSINDFARRVCDRHFGIGADGIAVWQKLNVANADFSARIINPDGSEANFSGNGTRCAVAFLHQAKIWTNENLRLSTKSGLKNYRLLESIDDEVFTFEAELGKPKFDSSLIPLLTDVKLEKVVDFDLIIDDETLKITAANVGNPVACVFVENFDFDWRKIGSLIENHPKFPERTNAIFVKILDKHNIEIKIWERGAGETLASGTCAVGAAVCACLKGETLRNVTVHSEGGESKVVWRESDDEILLTGRADFVFRGEWEIK